VRRSAVALPQTTEKLSHGSPTFFAPKKVYAMFVNNHHNDGHICGVDPVSTRAPATLLKTEPQKFSLPPYVGVKGWVGVELDAVSDEELGFHLTEAWRLICPKKHDRCNAGLGGSVLTGDGLLRFHRARHDIPKFSRVSREITPGKSRSRYTTRRARPFSMCASRRKTSPGNAAGASGVALLKASTRAGNIAHADHRDGTPEDGKRLRCLSYVHWVIEPHATVSR